MPLDPSIAMGFRLPQAEQPFQNIGGMLSLRSELMKQDEAHRQQQSRIAFENEVKALPEDQRTTENLVKIASKYAPAKELLHYGQQSLDRNAQIGATKELGLAKIAEANRFHNAQIADMFGKTQDRGVQQRLLAIKQASDDWARRAKVYYDTGQGGAVGAPPDVTGALMQIMMQGRGGEAPGAGAPQAIPQPQAAPQAAMGGMNIQQTLPSENSINLQGVNPQQISQIINHPDTPDDVRAALRGYVPPQGQPPAPSPMPQQDPWRNPPPQPAPMPSQQPDFANVGGGASSTAPMQAPMQPVQGQGVPVARAQAETPVMPEFTGSPRARQEAENRWKLQQAQTQAKVDAKLNVTGGRESVYVQRMMMGANQAAKDLANVVQLPLTASTGVFGGRKQGGGLLDAGREVLANKATGQEAQAYNAMATGFQRSLAQIESAGLMPSGSLTHQMDAVLFKEGDTNLTKLHKLAQTRQIVEAGMEVIEANPRVSPEEKAKIKNVLESVRKSVPFTHSDLIKLQMAQDTNPGATLKDVLGQSGPKEGDVSVSKSGKPMVYRNSKWEYKE